MGRFGYLFLSRIEQKLPVEPPEYLLLPSPIFPHTPFAEVQLKLMKNVYFLNGKCLAGLGTISKTGVWLRQLPAPCLGLIVLCKKAVSILSWKKHSCPWGTSDSFSL